jgi:hypothetical protein
MAEDLAFLSATHLAALYRTKDLSPAEVMGETLRRLECYEAPSRLRLGRKIPRSRRRAEPAMGARWPSPELTSRLVEIASPGAPTSPATGGRSVISALPENLCLNRRASAAYSLATDVKGERCGKQGAEAIGPRG